MIKCFNKYTVVTFLIIVDFSWVFEKPNKINYSFAKSTNNIYERSATMNLNSQKNSDDLINLYEHSRNTSYNSCISKKCLFICEDFKNSSNISESRVNKEMQRRGFYFTRWEPPCSRPDHIKLEIGHKNRPFVILPNGSLVLTTNPHLSKLNLTYCLEDILVNKNDVKFLLMACIPFSNESKITKFFTNIVFRTIGFSIDVVFLLATVFVYFILKELHTNNGKLLRTYLSLEVVGKVVTVCKTIYCKSIHYKYGKDMYIVLSGK